MSDKIEQLEPKLEKKLGFRNMHEKLEKNFCLMLVLFFLLTASRTQKVILIRVSLMCHSDRTKNTIKAISLASILIKISFLRLPLIN